MAICETQLDKLIADGNTSEDIVKAAEAALDNLRRSKAVSRAKKTGRYADPRTREDFTSKTFRGRTLVLESTEGNKFKEVKVVSESAVEGGVVINDDILLGNDNMTSDGAWFVTDILGSQGGKSNAPTTKLKDVSGTISQEIFDLAEELEQEEIGSPVLDKRHADHLFEILSHYHNVLADLGKTIDLNGEILEEVMIKGSEQGSNRGSVDPETGKFTIIKGHSKYTSRLEVLVHELQHSLIHNAVEARPGLKGRIEDLRNVIRDELGKDGKGYEIFLDGIVDPTSADVARAEEMYQYAFHNPDHGASEFLAFATTNKQVIKALDLKFKNVERELISKFDIGDGKSRIKKLLNSIIKVINSTYAAMTFGDTNPRKAAVALLTQALEASTRSVKEEEASIFDPIFKKVAEGDETISNLTGNIEKEEKDVVQILRTDTTKKGYEKAVGKLWKIGGLSRARSFALRNNLFSSLTRNSSNEDIGKFYDLFRQSKKLIDGTVTKIRTVTAKVLNEDFEFAKMSPGKRSAVKRVLFDTDVNAIGSIDEVMDILENNKLESEIEAFSVGLKPSTIKAAKDLAKLMASNVADTNNIFLNAKMIAKVVEQNEAGAKVEQIDKLTSLFALNEMSILDRDLAVGALKENKTGIKKALNLYIEHQKQLTDKAYRGLTEYSVKGQTHDHYLKDKKYYVVNTSDMNELVKKGKMSNIGKHDELSRILGEDRYVVIGDNIDTAYSEGLMSTVQLRNEGDSLKNILIKEGFTDKEADEKIKNEINSTNRNGNNLIPDRDFNGRVYDYRLRIPQSVKEKYLDLDNDIVPTLGSTVANLTHKDEAMITNKASLRHLNKFYNKYKNNKDFKFVEVSKDSTGKAKEYWDIMPYYLKNELKAQTGGEKMFVEESMLIDYFGYKDASLANVPLFNDNIKWKNRVRKLESIAKEIVQNWKKVIVTMTGATITGNLSSNMLVTLQNTTNKTPTWYAKRFTEVWTQLNKYQKEVRDLQRLKLLKEAGDKIPENKIKELETSLKKNPVHALMEDGQYTAILEDIDLGMYENKGILAGMVDDMLGKVGDKNRRENTKAILDTLYLNNDSKVYQKLLKLTQYGDIINRVIIHEDNMLNEKMGEKESLRYVDGLFVNYAYLDNKYIKWLNDMGMLTFTKFFFRTMPAMLRMAAKKPLTIFLGETSQAVTGIDPETPLDQFYDPFTTLFNKLFVWDQPINMLETLLTPRLFRPLD